MKNTTIGLDTSLNSPTTTISIDEAKTNQANTTISLTTNPIENLPEGTYFGFIHASNVQIDLAKLLANVLSQIDASVPNKDQNRAMKHLIRKQFDKTLMEIHEMAWPSLGDPNQQNACPPVSGYILEPQ